MLLDPKAKGNVLDAKIGFVAPVFLALHHLPLIKLSNYRKQLFSCFLLSAEIHPLKDFLPNVAFNKTTFTNCLKKKSVLMFMSRMHVRTQTYGHKDPHKVIRKTVIFILTDCRV